MSTRVVRPETARLTISRGEWLLVKKRLNHGEQQDAFAYRYTSDVLGTRINLRRTGMEFVLAYLIDWNLTGLDDKPLVIAGRPIEDVEAALMAIDPESFQEIKTAIDQHVEAMAAAREQEKNARDGGKDESAISPSPSAVAGLSSGFETLM